MAGVNSIKGLDPLQVAFYSLYFLGFLCQVQRAKKTLATEFNNPQILSVTH